MKPSNEFFNEILKVLKQQEPEIAKSLDCLIKDGSNDKEIFLWLQKKSESAELPREVEKLLTDLFFSMR